MRRRLGQQHVGRGAEVGGRPRRRRGSGRPVRRALSAPRGGRGWSPARRRCVVAPQPPTEPMTVQQCVWRADAVGAGGDGRLDDQRRRPRAPGLSDGERRLEHVGARQPHQRSTSDGRQVRAGQQHGGRPGAAGRRPRSRSTSTAPIGGLGVDQHQFDAGVQSAEQVQPIALRRSRGAPGPAPPAPSARGADRRPAHGVRRSCRLMALAASCDGRRGGLRRGRRGGIVGRDQVAVRIAGGRLPTLLPSSITSMAMASAVSLQRIGQLSTVVRRGSRGAG